MDKWILQYEPESPKQIEPLMGWTASTDMKSQIKLKFDSKEEAIAYDIGLPKDYGQAAIWYRRAADQGEAIAQVNLGEMYETGRGVTKDFAQAANWYRRAADKGDADAQYHLGQM